MSLVDGLLDFRVGRSTSICLLIGTISVPHLFRTAKFTDCVAISCRRCNRPICWPIVFCCCLPPGFSAVKQIFPATPTGHFSRQYRWNIEGDSVNLFDSSLLHSRHLFQSRMAELDKSVRASSDGNSDVFSATLSIVKESIFNINTVGDWFNWRLFWCDGRNPSGRGHRFGFPAPLGPLDLPTTERCIHLLFRRHQKTCGSQRVTTWEIRFGLESADAVGQEHVTDYLVEFRCVDETNWKRIRSDFTGSIQLSCIADKKPCRSNWNRRRKKRILLSAELVRSVCVSAWRHFLHLRHGKCEKINS